MEDDKPSLDGNQSSVKSNEHLIDSLITDLKKECVVDNSDLKSSNSSDPQTKCNDSETIDSTCNDHNSSFNDNSEDESSNNDKEIPSLEDDLVDELAMKDLELNLTDDDRQRLHNEADVFKQEGNELFKSGDYRDSALSYTKALRTCPLSYTKDRAIFYSNRAAAKMKLEMDESAIEDCTKALELEARYLKALFRRAQLYEKTEKLDEALVDYKQILEIDPLHRDALYSTKRLPDQIQERNEKLKAEMMGKLKDLGNMFLRPFGLSADNFQMTQDPNSGGYSINFKS